ncbi:MAG: hypothetical protein AAFS13_10775 [Pseudomonadota bacterium]
MVRMSYIDRRLGCYRTMVGIFAGALWFSPAIADTQTALEVCADPSLGVEQRYAMLADSGWLGMANSAESRDHLSMQTVILYGGMDYVPASGSLEEFVDRLREQPVQDIGVYGTRDVFGVLERFIKTGAVDVWLTNEIDQASLKLSNRILPGVQNATSFECLLLLSTRKSDEEITTTVEAKALTVEREEAIAVSSNFDRRRLIARDEESGTSLEIDRIDVSTSHEFAEFQARTGISHPLRTILQTSLSPTPYEVLQ